MLTIICNFLIFFPFSKNVDYHMQFFEFLSLLQKHGLSYSMSRISFPSPKTWIIICFFWNSIPFSNNVDYHIQFLEFRSLLKKHGLSYGVSRISFPSPKTWTIICNL